MSTKSSNTPTTVEALEEKVNQAASSISVVLLKWFTTHNSEGIAKGAPASGEAYIWDRLEKLGIYRDVESHELLIGSHCTEGEARRVFCENGEPNLPPVRFKKMWSILKGSSETIEAAEKDPNLTVVTHESDSSVSANTIKEIVKAVKDSNKPIGQWSDEELLNKYEPDCEQEVVETLEKRAKGKAFIIYDDETTNKVNVEASVSMLRKVRKGHSPVHYKVGTALKRLYRAGHFACETVYECPLHPGQILLVDEGVGYCDTCGHEWKIDAYENMQFARIVYEMGDAPKDKHYLRQFVNDCNTGTLEQLGLDFPKALLKFEERKNDDTLPRLKKRSSVDNRGLNDPMNVRSQTF